LSHGTRQRVVGDDFMQLKQIFATLAIIYLTEQESRAIAKMTA